VTKGVMFGTTVFKNSNHVIILQSIVSLILLAGVEIKLDVKVFPLQTLAPWHMAWKHIGCGSTAHTFLTLTPYVGVGPAACTCHFILEGRAPSTH
jgi:hypothetical protein